MRCNARGARPTLSKRKDAGKGPVVSAVGSSSPSESICAGEEASGGAFRNSSDDETAEEPVEGVESKPALTAELVGAANGVHARAKMVIAASGRAISVVYVQSSRK
jgi:hypothetical protein